MIFSCDWCDEKYDEKDEEQIILGNADCKMICHSCSQYYKSTGKIYQPERSKREDIEDLGHDFVTVGCTDHTYCTKCSEENHVIKSTMMRCSELYGDIERPAEKIWPA